MIPNAHILRGILDCDMPRKYQTGKLEVRKGLKRPYYYVRVTIPRITASGKTLVRERKIIGYCDELSKKEALKIRAELLETINSGLILAQSQVKFKALVQRFLEVRVPALGFATQNKYRTQIERHILPAFGEQQLREIDRPAVESWLHSKEQEGLGWWSRVDLKGVLSAIFTTAKAWKVWEGENPTEGVRIGKKRLVREKRLLTAEQLRSIIAAVDDRARFIVLLLFHLGLRISECLGLKWEDVDLKAGTVRIRRRWYRGDLGDDGVTKSEASERVLQLGPLVEEFLLRHPGPGKEHTFVFVGDDGKMPPDDRDVLRYEFRPVLKRLGLYYAGFGWHTFRRQNVTWRQTVGGATPLEAMRAAGHGSVDMSLLYTLTDADRERAQVQAMWDKLMGEPKGPTQ